MTNVTKPLCLACAVGLFSLAAGPVGAAQSDDASSTLFALFGDKVIAKGEGVEVKQAQLDESVVTIKSSAASRGTVMRPDMVERLEREVLQRLINIQLLLNRATDADKTQGGEMAEKRMGMLVERAGTEEAFTRSLTAVGMNREKLRSNLVRESTAQMVLERELNINVSDADVKKFYDENPARFEQPEMVRAAHILLRTVNPTSGEELSPDEKAAVRRKLEGLRDRAIGGEDFAKLAREYSQDAASRDNGGEYTFPRGRMVPAFEATAFSLPPGKISEVIETRFGYHVIKVYEKIPAKTMELDDDVAQEIREFLKTQQSRERMAPLITQMMAEAQVEILVDRLKPVEGEAVLPTSDTPLLPSE